MKSNQTGKTWEDIIDIFISDIKNKNTARIRRSLPKMRQLQNMASHGTKSGWFIKN